MINEFIPYKEALALKELGFHEPCFGYYTGNKMHLVIKPAISRINEPEGYVVTAPIFSQAFKFFRELYNWQTSIEATKDQHRFELGYNYWIWNSETGEEYHTMPLNCPSGDYAFKTYEESELNCLRKLIELVKVKEL